MDILLADGSVAMRTLIRAQLEREPGCRVVGEAASAPTVIQLSRDLQPDVVVLDHCLPGYMPTVDLVRYVRAANPAGRIVVLLPLGVRRTAPDVDLAVPKARLLELPRFLGDLAPAAVVAAVTA